MSYLTLAIKEEFVDIANAIAVAFEPDPNISITGYNAFSVKCKNDSGEIYYAYGADVNDFIFSNFEDWKSDPTTLQNLVKLTYTEKFEEKAPTKTQCQKFCDNVLISKQYGVIGGLSELQLEIDNGE